MTKRARLWIADGHNLIFRIPHLERLQVQGRRREARRGLEQLLRAFAARTGEKVVVVYDGNELESNPDAVREELLETVYAYPPEEADDRILFLARQHAQGGRRVRVITSDLRTLGARLPAQTPHVTWEDFRARHLRDPEAEPAKPAPGDLSEVAEEILLHATQQPPDEADIPSPAAPAASMVKEVPPGGTAREPGASAPGRFAPRRMDAAAREALERKRERGRRKQARRLKQQHRRKSR